MNLVGLLALAIPKTYYVDTELRYQDLPDPKGKGIWIDVELRYHPSPKEDD